ncbi:MAG: YggU family protein [Phycisphaerales bacterium]|nr:MAG: YggU family protein [Phycisphaerales bacterium]
MLELVTEENGVLLPVKVVPGASQTRLLGLWEKRAKIAVAAPPERGKANKAVIAFLADLLGLRKHDVRVVAGSTSPLKTIRIEQVTEAAVRAALQLDRS